MSKLSESAKMELQALKEAGLYKEPVVLGDGGSGDGGSGAPGSGDGSGEGAAAAAASAGGAGDGGSAAPVAPQEEKYALKDIFGDRYKTIDEFKSSDVFKKAEEADTLRQKVQELSQKSEEILNPWANDHIKKLNAFAKNTGITDMGALNLVTGVKSDSDPVEIIFAEMVLGNPKYLTMESDVKDMIRKNYKVDGDELTESEKRINQIKLQSDAESSYKKISEVTSKLETPSVDDLRKNNEADIEKRRVEWTPVVDKLSEGFKKIPVFGDGQDPVSNIELSDDEVSAYKKHAIDFIVGQKLPFNEESLRTATGYIRNRFLIENQSKIIAKVVAETKNALNLEWEKKIASPSGGQRTDKPPGGQSKKSASDLAYEAEFNGR